MTVRREEKLPFIGFTTNAFFAVHTTPGFCDPLFFRDRNQDVWIISLASLNNWFLEATGISQVVSTIYYSIQQKHANSNVWKIQLLLVSKISVNILYFPLFNLFIIKILTCSSTLRHRFVLVWLVVHIEEQTFKTGNGCIYSCHLRNFMIEDDLQIKCFYTFWLFLLLLCMP